MIREKFVQVRNEEFDQVIKDILLKLEDKFEMYQKDNGGLSKTLIAQMSVEKIIATQTYSIFLKTHGLDDVEVVVSGYGEKLMLELERKLIAKLIEEDWFCIPIEVTDFKRTYRVEISL